MRPSGIGLALLGVILAYVAWSHLPTLDHPYLPGWDEAARLELLRHGRTEEPLSTVSWPRIEVTPR